MTAITIERAFLIKVLDQLDIAQSLLERSQHHAKMAAMYEELRTALAAPAQPAWHVAPTVPGLWLNSVFMKVEDVEQWHIDCQLHLECARWYGPIPPDGDKP